MVVICGWFCVFVHVLKTRWDCSLCKRMKGVCSSLKMKLIIKWNVALSIWIYLHFILHLHYCFSTLFTKDFMGVFVQLTFLSKYSNLYNTNPHCPINFKRIQQTTTICYTTLKVYRITVKCRKCIWLHCYIFSLHYLIIIWWITAVHKQAIIKIKP